ncbi:threonine/homoserine/homoserine lactone efflux protein [Halopolyspora algeriensis]|uniref:Threonine/homoserine/homoserine lactone efflux protein n=1 Tax=Halopolyspora algeriensis TaxID=1500506 RepID=A0A368VU06_9ACTN|nr:LysE family translocator [Halopolyspora algeriensis]RCW45235.1 threonine/homoserine/homoserine lactone efflux protein [Halopolyspora algeriensis]TQM53046.1 threonine/homoserine/homoserine lactone efflux protein [Halopolyspora algeriensis]
MPDQLLPFLLLAVLITVAPGPDTALGLRNSLRGGTSAMWWTGLGCCSGLLVHAAASVAGLSALLAASAAAYTVVKIAGAAYLVWLGASTLWKSWRHRNNPLGAAVEPTGAAQDPARSGITKRAAFRQGLISNLLNPKIIILFLTLIPQFVSPEEPQAMTSIVLALSFLAVGLTWWRLASWLVGSLQRFVTRHRVRLTLERLTGTAMVALGLRVAAGP